jgi:hypothetical protein
MILECLLDQRKRRGGTASPTPPYFFVGRHAARLGVLWLALGLAACGEEASEQAVGECPDDQQPGIWGVVVAPDGTTPVSSAVVTVLDGLQAPVTDVTAGFDGAFEVALDALPGDGTYILTGRKGPYQGPKTPQPFEVVDGCSPRQTLPLDRQ